MEDYVFSLNDLSIERLGAGANIGVPKSNEDKLREMFSGVSEGLLERMRKWTSTDVPAEKESAQIGSIFDILLDAHTELYGDNDEEWCMQVIQMSHDLWRAKIINDKQFAHLVDECVCY